MGEVFYKSDKLLVQGLELLRRHPVLIDHHPEFDRGGLPFDSKVIGSEPPSLFSERWENGTALSKQPCAIDVFPVIRKVSIRFYCCHQAKQFAKIGVLLPFEQRRGFPSGVLFVPLDAKKESHVPLQELLCGARRSAQVFLTFPSEKPYVKTGFYLRAQPMPDERLH
ncbi:hypothetical protein [Brevibacillus antibioticus]|uniref:hypothetical protein n=1 Tax=Brevibacillus antibioticus TaxID=2570228 RepID=UPI00138FE2BE|nr:hypothetical protein [Brevibacillus antibioticus]